MTLFLSIRSLDGQMPSAYVQELKFSPPIAGGFHNIRRRVLAHPPSWFHMVRPHPGGGALHAAPGLAAGGLPPGAGGHPWRSLRLRPRPLPAMEDPYWTKSPDLAAIRAAEALPHDMPARERRAQVLEIFRNSGDGTRFDPFAPADKELLRAAYARDLERIAALDPGHPDPGLTASGVPRRNRLTPKALYLNSSMISPRSFGAHAAAPQGSVSKVRPIWKKTALLWALSGSSSRLR